MRCGPNERAAKASCSNRNSVPSREAARVRMAGESERSTKAQYSDLDCHTCHEAHYRRREKQESWWETADIATQHEERNDAH